MSNIVVGMVLGFVLGVCVMGWLEDEIFSDRLKAGVFEKDGIAYHLEVIPK